MRVDDVAGNIHWSLGKGARRRRRASVQSRGRGVIENRHSTDVESTDRVRASV